MTCNGRGAGGVLVRCDRIVAFFRERLPGSPPPEDMLLYSFVLEHESPSRDIGPGFLFVLGGGPSAVRRDSNRIRMQNLLRQSTCGLV